MALQSEIKSTDWTLDAENPGKIVQGVDCIKQCVKLICKTKKGTDPLRPDFGCSAYDYIDMPTNIAVPRIVKSIIDALKKYEPRIDSIKVTATSVLEKTAFRIGYHIKNTTINDQLEITYGS